MRVNRYLRKPIRTLTVSPLRQLIRPFGCRRCGPHVFFGGADGV
jgi:hypothetical protein